MAGKSGAVPQRDQASFSYAVYSFFFGMLPILLAFVLGVLFRMLQGSLFMILHFMLIHKFGGGYHFCDPKKSIIFSSLQLFSVLWCVKIFLVTRTVVLLPSLLSLATLRLCVLSPIGNDARKLSERERHAFRRIARILSVTAYITYLVLQITTPKLSSVPVGVGIILVAVLQLPCIPRKLGTYAQLKS